MMNLLQAVDKINFYLIIVKVKTLGLSVIKYTVPGISVLK